MGPKVIIDTDPGQDDALAILMLLEAHKNKDIEVIAFTTVCGSTSTDNVNKNLLRVLDTAGFLEIPVYPGAVQPLIHQYQMKHFHHGLDGFGDAEFSSLAPDVSLLQKKHAAPALVDLVNAHSGEVILLALGPLTNVAVAMSIDPAFTSKLFRFYLMGGNFHGEGNFREVPEFNFKFDPEAAFIVLERTEKPIYVTPWETCGERLKITYEMREEIGNLNTPGANFLNKIEENKLRNRLRKFWISCDSVAAAWLLDDVYQNQSQSTNDEADSSKQSLVTETVTGLATVVIASGPTRGLMMLNSREELEKKPNVFIMVNVRQAMLIRYLQMAFGGQF